MLGYNFKKRMNIPTYIVASILVFIIDFPLLWLVSSDESPLVKNDTPWFWVVWIIAFYILSYAVMFAKQRVNDFRDEHAVLVLIALYVIPFGTFALWIARSQPKQNRYGNVPPRGVKLLRAFKSTTT